MLQLPIFSLSLGSGKPSSICFPSGNPELRDNLSKIIQTQCSVATLNNKWRRLMSLGSGTITSQHSVKNLSNFAVEITVQISKALKAAKDYIQLSVNTKG